MKRALKLIPGFVLLTLVLFLTIPEILTPRQVEAASTPALAGRVVDAQQQPISRAHIALFVNGAHVPSDQVSSHNDGTFLIGLPCREDETTQIDTARLEISHLHFYPTEWEAGRSDLADLNSGFVIRLTDIVLERRLTVAFWIATLAFVGMILLIATETLHSTMAALLGVSVILGVSLVGGTFNSEFVIFDFDHAIEYVDFGVIFLVMGMMISVGVIERTGVFRWLSFQAYNLSGGRVWLVAILLVLLTAASSTVLENVTTMLVIAPITLQIALTLGVDPRSLLIPEVIAANLGGTATLIGSPANVMIGSYAEIGFTDFATKLAPGALIAQLALIICVLWLNRREYRRASGQVSETLMARLAENARISDPTKLRRAGSVFLATLVLFVVGERLHLEPAVTAIIGAVAILLVVRADITQMLKVVDWTTLMFLIALFIIVGAVQEVGLVSFAATGLARVVSGNLTAGILMVVGSSALLSTVIANNPLTAAMLPVVGFLSTVVPGGQTKVLFYALSFGAAVGGSGSLIGASANLVTAGIADRAGFPVSYSRYAKIGFPAMLVTAAVGTAWLLLRF
jgi:Na+/H+ antiporter NhaD/arsenite permease-like protein